MNCKELAYLLGDYFEGIMEAHLREELEAHLADCEPCVRFLRTYGKTREAARLLEPAQIPEEVRQRLRDFILRKAREHFAEVAKYLPDGAAERRRAVAALLDGYRHERLAPPVAAQLEMHRSRCPLCGAFVEALRNGDTPVEIPPEVEEHLAAFVDVLPPGEGSPPPS